MISLRSIRACAALLFAVAVAPRAAASPSAASTASADATSQALDEEGTALLDHGQYASACPKLAESFRLKPGTGVLMRLALCQQLAGKDASAWASFRDAEHRARATGNETLASLAARRAAALEPSLSTLEIRVAPDVAALPQLSIREDGVAIEPWVAGTPRLVDPGVHVVEVRAPGRAPLRVPVEVARGGAHVVVPIAALEAEDEPTADGEPRRAKGATARVGAIASASVGVAGLLVGSALAVTAASKMSDARDLCPARTSCSDEALRLQDTAHTRADAATVAFGIGAAGIVGGAILWLTAPRAEAAERRAWQVAPAIGRAGAGLSIVRAW